MPVWNSKNIAHLLSRTLFGFSKNDLSAAQGYSTYADLLDQVILKDYPLPAAPNTWVNTVPAASQNTSGETGTWYREFNYWWFNRMNTEGLRMREKMVLFFHNHSVQTFSFNILCHRRIKSSVKEAECIKN
jgi:hypothetical protein